MPATGRLKHRAPKAGRNGRFVEPSGEVMQRRVRLPDGRVSLLFTKGRAAYDYTYRPTKGWLRVRAFS